MEENLVSVWTHPYFRGNNIESHIAPNKSKKKIFIAINNCLIRYDVGILLLSAGPYTTRSDSTPRQQLQTRTSVSINQHQSRVTPEMARL